VRPRARRVPQYARDVTAERGALTALLGVRTRRFVTPLESSSVHD